MVSYNTTLDKLIYEGYRCKKLTYFAASAGAATSAAGAAASAGAASAG